MHIQKVRVSHPTNARYHYTPIWEGGCCWVHETKPHGLVDEADGGWVAVLRMIIIIRMDLRMIIHK